MLAQQNVVSSPEASTGHGELQGLHHLGSGALGGTFHDAKAVMRTWKFFIWGKSQPFWTRMTRTWLVEIC